MEAKSLEDVYKYYMNDLYKYLLQLSGHPQIAEDLVQDTFIKAYEHLEGYQGEKVRPWLFRVAYNAYIDWYRKNKKLIHTDPQLLADLSKDMETGPEEDYLEQERLRNWFRVVNSLPEKGRQVILLRDYYDFTYEDIAQVLKLNLSNVKVTLYRARQKIKEVMGNENEL
ncbi:MAG: hypothetical protein APF76_02020 [Desulfitibacter sp. BRH_c19]|nr:MAG: hypothetical protein APF76_02020 [Desulfitibacter sp. BRH_c19]